MNVCTCMKTKACHPYYLQLMFIWKIKPISPSELMSNILTVIFPMWKIVIWFFQIFFLKKLFKIVIIPHPSVYWLSKYLLSHFWPWGKHWSRYLVQFLFIYSAGICITLVIFGKAFSFIFPGTRISLLVYFLDITMFLKVIFFHFLFCLKRDCNV